MGKIFKGKGAFGCNQETSLREKDHRSLLSHALKDSPDQGECKNRSENEELQYGAWMKGVITRRYMHESPKVRIRRGTDIVSSQWNAGVKLGRRLAMNRPHGE